MKKLLAILLVSFIGMASVANADHGSIHSADTSKPVSKKPYFTTLLPGQNSSMYVFHDTENNCQYLVYIHSVGTSITARRGNDGKPICFDVTKPEAEKFSQ